MISSTGRLLDRQVGRLAPFEHLFDIIPGPGVDLSAIRSIGHQPAGLDGISEL